MRVRAADLKACRSCTETGFSVVTKCALCDGRPLPLVAIYEVLALDGEEIRLIHRALHDLLLLLVQVLGQSLVQLRLLLLESCSSG